MSESRCIRALRQRLPTIHSIPCRKCPSLMRQRRDRFGFVLKGASTNCRRRSRCQHPRAPPGLEIPHDNTHASQACSHQCAGKHMYPMWMMGMILPTTSRTRCRVGKHIISAFVDCWFRVFSPVLGCNLSCKHLCFRGSLRVSLSTRFVFVALPYPCFYKAFAASEVLNSRTRDSFL